MSERGSEPASARTACVAPAAAGRPPCRRRRWRRGALAAAALALPLVLAWGLDRAYPLPAAARAHTDGGLVVTAADGSPLRAYPSADGAWRYPVAAAEVAPAYLEALLTYEDRWFFVHPGVNPLSLARAGWQRLRSGRIVSGGSTLTMQVARMIDPVPAARRRTLPAKLRQIGRALQLEWHLSKQAILALYLNHAPMGGIVEGVEMASRVYLGKSAALLSHAEAALLAVLPQAPSRLRPDRAPAAARAARDKVLDRMSALGRWPATTVADARSEPIVVQPLQARWLAPLAAERLRQARRQAGPGADGRAQIRSTLDPEWQSVVETLLLDRVAALPPRVSMAVLAIDNASLAVKAYAGSADFSDPRRAAHVDMVRGVRSPGSTLKPFVYALALDAGLIHSESLLADAPQSFDGYRPGNFQAAFAGPVSVSEALQRSLNVPAVDMLQRVGPVPFASALRAAGVRLRMGGDAAPNLSLILGGGGTTLEELVGAYRALAWGGVAGLPRLEPDAPRVEARLMSEGAAFVVRDILETGGSGAPPRGAGLAWKTGTSFGFRDAWAVGVTDTATVGVWIGRPDGTPNPGYFGANAAAPLLRDIAAALPLPAPRPRTLPATVERVAICWPLGGRADATDARHCLARRVAWSVDGAVPPTLPDRDAVGGLLEPVWLTPEGRRTRPGCPRAGEPRQVARWPAALAPWRDAGLLPGPPLAAWDAACPARAVAGNLVLAGLEAGAVLRPVPGAREVRIEVRARGGEAPYWWMLDGQPLAARGAGVALVLDRPGARTLTVMDAAGRAASLPFRVRAGAS